MSRTSVMERLHALDALRATMMLLGLVLHASASYTVYPIPLWPFHDTHTNGILDLLLVLIHLFRMPTFFVMAGFFAAFLYYREGARGFLVHRVRRLLLPLVVAWIVVFPTLRAGGVFAALGGRAAGFDAAVSSLSTPYADASLGYLWFLYDLFLLCVIAIAAVPLVERLPAGFRARVVASFGKRVPTVLGCLALGIVSALTMLPMESPGIDTSTSFLPAGRLLVAYGVFFSFGWLLFVRRDIVPEFGRRPWRYVVSGLIMCVVYVSFIAAPHPENPDAVRLAAIFAGGVATWLLVFGSISVFVRYFNVPRPVQRYLSDASYWMYLAHITCVIWLAGLLAPLDLPAVAKFAFVLAGTAITTLVTYHLFVRFTVIGVFLNGSRVERRSSQRESSPAAAAPIATD